MVHAFRNSTDQPVRFINRDAPALGFQDHLVTVQRLIQAGKVRTVSDPRSMIYLCMSQNRHRSNRGVKPPQWLVDGLAWVGGRLRSTLE